MRIDSRVLLVAILGLAAGCSRRIATPIATDPVAQLTDGFDANVRRDVETLRNATAAFRDLAAAQAAGYPTTIPQCVADSTMGGMGHHFVNRPLFDETLQIEHPEMLIYAPAGNGKFELVGVEYVVPFRVRPPTEPPPRLFGQQLRKYDEFRYWAIHVWAWRRNAAGLFSDWNPAVKC